MDQNATMSQLNDQKYLDLFTRSIHITNSQTLNILLTFACNRACSVTQQPTQGMIFLLSVKSVIVCSKQRAIS